ncbi:MAG: methyl-accepting chemotaxis protein [Sulfuricella sp.]|nr:methyl-accepting chemotaxis protein [Sulfuricella sp.]
MLNNIHVGPRLFILVALMAAFMVVIGIVGLSSMSKTVNSLNSVYEQRTVPLASLARVDRQLSANNNEVLRAFQHNPAFDIAKLHDHPTTDHNKRIEKNLPEIAATWEKYKSTNLSPEEKRLADEFEKLSNEWRDKILLPTLAALSKGDFSNDVVSHYLVGSRTIAKPMNEAMTVLIQLQIRIAKEEYTQAEANYAKVRMISIASIIGGLAIGLLVAWSIIRSIATPLNQMRATIGEVEQHGDFTLRIPVISDDEVGQTAKSFNHLMAALQQSLGEVLDSIARVSGAAKNLSDSSRQVAHSSEAQSESTSSMAAAVEQMTVSINHVSGSAQEAVAISRKSGSLSSEGRDIINKAAAEMARLADTVRNTSGVIEELGQHSNQISSIVQVIKDVADQTNLLALNAAIEAARAGEQGRGFAVVADEVRKLAERTTKATEEITQMIGNMQHSAQTAVSTMGSAVEQVNSGVALANQAGASIIQIKDGADRVVGVVDDISAALAEQSSASNEIAGQVEKVAQMTEENSATAHETSDAAANLQELANAMRSAVGRFRIECVIFCHSLHSGSGKFAKD